MLSMRPIEGNVLDAQQLPTSYFDEHVQETDLIVARIQ